MGIILWSSGEVLSADATSAVLLPLLAWLFPWAGPDGLIEIHTGLRKLAHVAAYAILGALWYHAWARGRGLPQAHAAWLAFGISAAWGVVDEGRQATMPSRTGSAGDVALDSVAAALTVLVSRRRRCRAARS
jgi:VanZ family protein